MWRFRDKLSSFINNRWLVFVAAIWIQSCGGVGYLFGSLSPTIKSSLSYNQRQIARLGVAKDLGDSVGFLAGSLSEILPLWGVLLVGAIQNLVGYGWLWLVVTGRTPVLPLWAVCILIFVATNGETYFNTASLVSCVQNFPKNRGPVVGVLKGFAGLSGAILTQIYALVNSPDHASLIFMVAVAPTIVVISLMFLIRPVGGHKQIRPTDDLCASIIYTLCVLLGVYLLGVMVIEALVHLSPTVVLIFTVILFVFLLFPIVVPLTLTLSEEPKPSAEEVLLLPDTHGQGTSNSKEHEQEIIFSEFEDEKPKDVDLLPALERHKRIAQLQAKLAQAAAEGAVRIKKRRPHRGEDFTLTEALIKADLWLMFFSLLLGSGSGLTVIDNMGQLSQSLGYENAQVFVSLISIWNFLGRVVGGIASEKIVKDFAYPRHVSMAVAQAAMAVAQAAMAVGHFLFAMGWPGVMYIGTVLVGLGYGAHWAIAPAAASELFGLKKFGAIYNFLTLANPAGSLVFSGIIASYIYDHEAEKQAHGGHTSIFGSFSRYILLEDPPKCVGSICFFLTFMIMSGFCIIAVILSLILVYRTKPVYANLYGRAQR